MVRPDITSPAGLKGKKIADPQLGGTQDTALRWYLKAQGFKTDTAGGGDVSVLPEDNSQTLTAFKQGQIDGAWVPEPWASRLVIEGGGRILVDERDLWPNGRFVTTNLIVSTQFLHDHPKRSRALLEGLYNANAFMSSNPSEAQFVAVTLSQEVTPPELRARVFGARIALLNLSWLPIILISGALADRVDAGILIGVAGAVTLATAVFAARFLPAVSEVA